MLSPRSLAYYHWLRGIVDVTDNRLAAARVHLLVAASGQLHTENDRCLVQCLLAEIAVKNGDHPAAKQHLQLAGNLAHYRSVGNILRDLAKRIAAMN